MSCSRCETLPASKPVDHVLLSAPHSSTRRKIVTHLAARGVRVAETPLGLRFNAEGDAWKQVLTDLAKGMNEPESRDTQVAVVPVSEDPVALQTAVFHSRRLCEVVEHFSHEWLYDVLRHDALVVHIHPLIQYPPGRVHGYECLLRAVGADGQLIPPGKIFAAARSLDLLFLLDQKARLAAVHRAAELQRTTKLDCLFFINFLPTAIYNPEHCLRSTLAAVEAGGLRPEQIVFEVVESEQVNDRNHLSNILRFYRDKGFRVALDDVGAGYSNLLALAHLRPDYIKLDGELVRGAAKGGLEGRMVRDLADACRQHGIITVAEGIETEEQLRFVLEAGIRITQGYIHGKPRSEPLTRTELLAALDRCDHFAESPRTIEAD